MDVLEWIINTDRHAFYLINSEWSNPAIDAVMIALRDAKTWIPLYAFIIYWSIRYAKPYTWMFILCSVACFALADLTSASLIKPLVHRLRPCYDSVMVDKIHILVGCGGQNSFPSSHASNHFALASFWFYAVQLIRKKTWYWLWLWAFMIGYAQVYVGKHFPGDILAGTCLGILIGVSVFYFFKRWHQKQL